MIIRIIQVCGAILLVGALLSWVFAPSDDELPYATTAGCESLVVVGEVLFDAEAGPSFKHDSMVIVQSVHSSPRKAGRLTVDVVPPQPSVRVVDTNVVNEDIVDQDGIYARRTVNHALDVAAATEYEIAATVTWGDDRIGNDGTLTYEFSDCVLRHAIPKAPIPIDSGATEGLDRDAVETAMESAYGEPLGPVSVHDQGEGSVVVVGETDFPGRTLSQAISVLREHPEVAFLRIEMHVER